MINRLKKLLIENDKVLDYVIREQKKIEIQLFYVLDKLETNRAVNTVDYSLTIYRKNVIDGKEYMGDATIVVYSYMTDDELKKEIENGLYMASFIKNPFFTLQSPNGEIDDVKSNMNGKNLIDFADDIVGAIFKANTYKDGWINSTEIFLSEVENRIVNSKGLDYQYKKSSGEVEIIPTWRNEGIEYELYKDFKFLNVDLKNITKEVDEILIESKNRSLAKKIDNINVKVLLRGSEALGIFNFFANQLNYSTHLQKMNLFNVGDDVIGSNTGDKLSITLKAYLDTSAFSSPIDTDGTVLSELKIIDNNIAKELWGNKKNADYLNMKANGIYQNISVAAGSKSVKEMKSEPYLEIVSFSAMQMDSFSGYFGGEVRLAYYFDGNNVIPVTGISVSGIIHERKKEMKLSKEVTRNGRYEGPCYVEFDNMTII